MKFYITKYALTKGIVEVEGEIAPSTYDRLIRVFNCRYMDYIRRPFWHVRKEDAIEHAEKMKKSKLKSLEKQIERVERLKFNVIIISRIII